MPMRRHPIRARCKPIHRTIQRILDGLQAALLAGDYMTAHGEVFLLGDGALGALHEPRLAIKQMPCRRSRIV